MKKLSIVILTLFLASMFNSCEDEEVASLIGKWLYGSVTFELYEDDVLVESGPFNEMDFEYLEFIKGGTLYVWFDSVEYETITWKKDGKTVTLDEGTEDEMVLKIETLTKTTLKVSFSEEEEEGGVVYKMVIKMNMTRMEE
jgi:hypothetical protein